MIEKITDYFGKSILWQFRFGNPLKSFWSDVIGIHFTQIKISVNILMTEGLCTDLKN